MNTYLINLLLVILSVSGNFFSELLQCQTKKLLDNNAIIKHFMELLTIYITIDFSEDPKESPINKMKKTFLFYMFFIMFTKMDLFFTATVFFILIILFMNNRYIQYYKNNNIQPNRIIFLKNLEKILSISVILLIVTGFSLNFFKNKKINITTWNYLKLFYGVVKCQ